MSDHGKNSRPAASSYWPRRDGNGFATGAAAAFAGVLMLLSGCTGPEGTPVLGAVFGLEDAAQAPFRVGKVPDPVVGPGDRVLGQAANNPGQCIYLRDRGRFRAPCPEGYQL